ncbi:EAL domain-containing protein [Pseudomonas sp. SL4(2022)]|uniref:EAL domain-containing protein n=1 Tax=Pseudomonas sp. SL4(2022) TaxID=2994661 RepID=UPI0022702E68|nr:EAL domain-containing protein [Pseudomonas sp. SL4(2022)]WAC45373.1 EAL domain-containing protein [Pseudomonas sp. SL4(2022)]
MKPPSIRLLASLLLMIDLALVSAVEAQPRSVKVGVYDNEPNYLLEQDGKLSGIFGDLLNEIAQQEGWQLLPQPCDWQQCLDQLSSGKIDLLPDVAYDESRNKVFDFHTHPALLSWSQLYSSKNLNLRSILDLHERRIAVLRSSVQAQYLRELLHSFGLKADLIEVQSLTQGFELVAKGQADTVAANQRFGDVLAPSYQLHSAPIMFQPTQLFYATRKGQNGELLAAIDQHLSNWQKSPTSICCQTLQRWGGEHSAHLIPAAAWWGLAILLALLTAALGGALLLRRQVREKTQHLLDSEQRLNTILDSVEAYIYIKDVQLRYQYVNRKVCELFGLTLKQVIGKTDDEFFDLDTASNLHENDRRVLELGERVHTEEVNRSLDGGNEHTFLSIKLPLRDNHGDIYALCGISTDITAHKKNLEKINQLAFYDPLTGLPNRRLLLDRLQQALAKHARGLQQGALLFIDLDNFKYLNDTLGHDVGDQLLQQVALRLSNHVRAQDTLARLGGDEFVLMLEGLNLIPAQAVTQVEYVSNKIITALAQPYNLSGHNHVSTASVGVTLFPGDHSTVDEVLKRADLAMYQAKSAGRNAVRFFDPQMQAAVNARASLERDLRQSLEEQRFILHYQPFFNEHGQLIGAEALVRWQHPQRGLVMPGDFIPLAESTGLILPLGRLILRQACEQLVVWAADPLLSELCLAINISAKQFHHPEFVTYIRAALEKSGADPLRLILELTESQLVEDIEPLISKMSQLKAQGIRLALDDFGAGYSSLNYLKRLPLDQLKIDRSFVQDLLTEPSDAAIVRTILALGANLNLAVTAEGVETQAQYEALLQMGCRQFQGYLFAKPGPASEIARS